LLELDHELHLLDSLSRELHFLQVFGLVDVKEVGVKERVTIGMDVHDFMGNDQTLQ